MKMPVQPLELFNKTVRFRKNRIVHFLLNSGPFDMDVINMIPEVTDEEKTQFAQLIGYSVYGAGQLPFFDEETYGEVVESAKKMKEERKGEDQ